MIITGSDITMASQHSLVERRNEQESLRFWVGSQRPDFEGQGASRPLPAQGLDVDVLDLSEACKTCQAENEEEIELSPEDKLKITIIEKLLEALTGRKVKIRVLDKLDLDDRAREVRLPQSGIRAAAGPRRAGWGLEYDYAYDYYESETLHFQASGVIKTADGRTIEFSTELGLSRAFEEHHRISLRAGDAKQVDPLIINFNGTAAQLTDTRYAFDLDSDGDNDYISFLAPGSGFLAVDRNGDGIINDGSELFGPSTGDGFAELEAYDEDRNGWIDENDRIFQRLLVWSKDAGGRDEVASIHEKGVGAIYLAKIETPFAYKNTAGQFLGQLRTSSIFVAEKGTVGTVQQVDLFA